MSEQDKAPARPQQVTVASLAVIGGSLVLLIAAFEQISTLHSLDTRTAVERLIGDQPSGLGITVEGWLRILKVVGMVTGACAAAAAILGWQTLQRSRGARIVLPVVAAPMVIAGLAIEPIFAILVAVAVVILWLPAASAWFNPEASLAKPPVMNELPPPPPAPSVPPASPASPSPYGAPTGQPGEPGPYPAPFAYPPPQQPSPYSYAAPVPAAPGRRPGAVTAAATLTFILSGLTAVLGVVLAIIGATVAQEMLDELHKHGYDTQGITAHELRLGLAFLGVLVTIAALIAVVAAGFVLRRSAAARVVLTVMSGLCIALSLAAITSIGSIVTLAGAIAVIVLLHRPAATLWFNGR